MTAGRIALFLSLVLSIWAAMHFYVFWRLSSVPWLAAHISRRTLVWLAVALWASYPLARILAAQKLDVIAYPVELLSANWVGVLFLLLSAFVAVDVVTAGGFIVARFAPMLRRAAALAAVLLSGVALVQGLRGPVLRDYEVSLPGLPQEHNGLTLVAISDLHLGSLLGEHWLKPVLDRVNELRPDLVVVVGDLVDANIGKVEPLVPSLKQLRAPLGVWAVTGNHEFYAGLEKSVGLFGQAGFNLLRDRSVEVASGLVLAGVDDLTARRDFGQVDHFIEKAVANRSPGALILLSHSPSQTEVAARLGVGLMLSGHTHDGQIWPFNYIVRTAYRHVTGYHEVDGMKLIIGRGTGTWGPRMRLWHRSEILRIRLKAAPVSGRP